MYDVICNPTIKMAVEKKNVFIAYPHNPELYEYSEPPDTIDQNILEQFEQYKRRKAEEQEQNVYQHKKLVHDFALFLQQNHVDVTYEQQIDDTGCGNRMKWYEEKIGEADYIIVIATPSLLTFLNKDAPDEEMLFAGEFFYTIINLERTSSVLSVFLNRPKDYELLPTTLKAGNVYQLNTPFTLDPRADDMERLYALLSGQNRFTTPLPAPTGPTPLRPKGKIHGGTREVTMNSQGRAVFERLSQIQAHLTDMQINSISVKASFHTRWRSLAPLLGLTPAQIEACEVNSGGYGQSEKCLQMLKKWRDTGLYGPPQKISVAHLAHQIYVSLRNMEMLGVLGECVH